MNCDLEHEWSQDELREYLIANGWPKEWFRPDEVIPQGVKFISFEPLTERDIERALELAREHPEWNNRK